MRTFTLFILLAPLLAFAKDDNGMITKKERKFASSILKDSKKSIYAAISNLTAEQWNYKPNDSTWSIAEICEHVAIVEQNLYTMVTEKVLKSEKNPSIADAERITDDELITRIKNRSEGARVKTASQFEPNGSFSSPTQFQTEFSTLRNRTIAFTKNTDAELKSYYQKNPLGNLSAYQWFLVMSTHTERHKKQINELMESNGFPI